MGPLTEADYQNIAARVTAILRAMSRDMGEVPQVTSLIGLTTLPAIRINGGITEVVRVSISLLGQPATDAAALANAAATNANAAATNANNAATNANAKATAAQTAATNADAKATAANMATTNANAAKTAADAAAANANQKASEAGTATANANAAALKATNAATGADSAAELANKAAAMAIANTNPLVVPTDISVEYPTKVTLSNNRASVQATALPSYVLQNIIFICMDSTAEIDPVTGKITPLKAGQARIHVIPAQRTQIRKIITINIISPVMRRLSANRIRKTKSGMIRLT